MITALVIRSLAVTTALTLDGILYYIPAEILIVVLLLLVSMCLLVYISGRLPSRATDRTVFDDLSDVTTRPANSKTRNGVPKDSAQ